MRFFYIICLFFVSISSHSEEVLTCNSFSGSWSKATISRDSKNLYKIEVKLWGAEPTKYEGSMLFLKYRDRSEFDDSLYEEVYYNFESKQLSEDLSIKYTKTSDGPDYLYLENSSAKSTLSCK